ncbi:MAG TPA: trehalase family glycosidase, partial [Tichowtungia sp.]|nr:trehalase family glycosidase [Tichowtungia sp.]
MGERFIRIIRSSVVGCSLTFVLPGAAEPFPPAGPVSPLVKRPAEYDAVQKRLATGWNTYENDSVLSHVRMPDGLAIRLGLEKEGNILAEALIGREEIVPGARTWNGETTELDLTWNGISIKVQSAASDDALVLLVTPEKVYSNAFLTVESKMLWERPGRVERCEDTLEALLPGDRQIAIRTSRPAAKWIDEKLCLPLSEGPLVITTGEACSAEKGTEIIAAARNKMIAARKKYGESLELYRAMQCVLAWDTIYEPEYDRVVATVSRVWNSSDLWQGWVLFDWDTYFASYIASIDNKDLAYACAYEMTRHLTPEGFVPNYAAGRGSSFDRSQPPVGSLMVRELYRRYEDKWFVDSLFDALLSWNRWWPEERTIDGYLSWGSDPWPEGRKGKLAAYSPRAARFESGLDNSVMWDDVSFNKATRTLELACVDLMSFYIADCNALADLADVLGRCEAAELRQRADHYTEKLQTLWNEDAGIFMNRRTDTGAFDDSLSPALFYPMLAGACTQEQADRMIQN